MQEPTIAIDKPSPTRLGRPPKSSPWLDRIRAVETRLAANHRAAVTLVADIDRGVAEPHEYLDSELEQERIRLEEERNDIAREVITALAANRPAEVRDFLSGFLNDCTGVEGYHSVWWDLWERKQAYEVDGNVTPQGQVN